MNGYDGDAERRKMEKIQIKEYVNVCASTE